MGLALYAASACRYGRAHRPHAHVRVGVAAGGMPHRGSARCLGLAVRAAYEHWDWCAVAGDGSIQLRDQAEEYLTLCQKRLSKEAVADAARSGAELLRRAGSVEVLSEEWRQLGWLVWETTWNQRRRGKTQRTGLPCLSILALTEWKPSFSIQKESLGRVPKQNPDQTLSTEGRPINDMRNQNADGSKFNHSRHPGVPQLCAKRDTSPVQLLWGSTCNLFART